jgi:hypothetical protein
VSRNIECENDEKKWKHDTSVTEGLRLTVMSVMCSFVFSCTCLSFSLNSLLFFFKQTCFALFSLSRHITSYFSQSFYFIYVIHDWHYFSCVLFVTYDLFTPCTHNTKWCTITKERHSPERSNGVLQALRLLHSVSLLTSQHTIGLRTNEAAWHLCMEVCCCSKSSSW